MNKNEILLDSILGNFELIKRALWKHDHTSNSLCLTRAQLGLLVWLRNKEDPQSTKDIAEHLHMTSSAVTQLVDSLVERELVKRTPSTTDRRKLFLSLTEEGEIFFQKAKSERARHVQKVLSPLSNEELQQLIIIQEKILNNFKDTQDL